jgi:hypothetical protein
LTSMNEAAAGGAVANRTVQIVLEKLASFVL